MMTVSEFIEILNGYDGDMPILTSTLETPSVCSVLGKVIIREHERQQPVVVKAPESDLAH